MASGENLINIFVFEIKRCVTDCKFVDDEVSCAVIAFW